MIMYNAGRIKVYENLRTLAKLVGETEEFSDALWQGIMLDDDMIEEFNYFLANGTLKGKVTCSGYSLLDLYFSQMNKYNLIHDMGKNYADCNKERMVLHAFYEMVMMRNDPSYLASHERHEESSNDKL